MATDGDARGCAKGGALFETFAACVKTCTCGIDVRDRAIDAYCNAEFTRDWRANSACMCLGMRCHVQCVEEALCPKTPAYNEECWKLEDVMPCSIGCPDRSGSISSSSNASLSSSQVPQQLDWDFTLTPCVTDIKDEAATPVEEPRSVGPSQLLIGIIGGAVVLVFLVIMGGIAARALRRSRQQQQGQEAEREAEEGSAGQGQASRGAAAPPGGPSEQPQGERVPGPKEKAVDPQDFSNLTVKELKALIAEAGLSSADCLEKEELVARAREAQMQGLRFDSQTQGSRV